LLEIQNLPIPLLKPNQVLIRLHYGALNHRDNWCTQGLYPNLQFDSVMGGDGAGIVIGVENVQRDGKLIGVKVLINPSIGWKLPDSPPSSQFGLLGQKPYPGTFATHIIIDRHQVYDIPSHLSLAEAAALPLAGLTAYRAVVTKGQIKKDDIVLIPGIGSGVALASLQLCLALGAMVYVTSSCPQKIQKAINLGARGGVLYTSKDWANQLLKSSGKFDAIIDGNGGDSLNDYLKILKVSGKIVCYGATAGRCENFNLHILFLKNIDLKGTSVGSDLEFQNLLKFVEIHNIHPVVDSVVDFHDFQLALEKMRSHTQFGKLLLCFQDNGQNPKSKL